MSNEAKLVEAPMWHSENVEDGLWSATFYFGKGDEACKSMRKFSDDVRQARIAATRPNADVVVDALKLARNRLQRAGLELPHGSLKRIECFEWADEATAALSAFQQETDRG